MYENVDANWSSLEVHQRKEELVESSYNSLLYDIKDELEELKKLTQSILSKAGDCDYDFTDEILDEIKDIVDSAN